MVIENRKQKLREELFAVYENTAGNGFPQDTSLPEKIRGLRFFDRPLIGFGDAADPLFSLYKQPGVIGPWYRTPKEWFPDALTVLSFFFPFSEEVRASNRKESEYCSLEWACGRIEGQEFLTGFTKNVCSFFESRQIPALAPGLSPKFHAIRGKSFVDPETGITIPDGVFSSNWSERHAAYVCGLGTFGLSKGLITEKGMAGRLSSLLIGTCFPPDPRPYDGVYDYCIRCGACARRCPLHAITPEDGKDHALCSPYRERNLTVHAPRFGCGLCQTSVPCEYRNPIRSLSGNLSAEGLNNVQ